MGIYLFCSADISDVFDRMLAQKYEKTLGENCSHLRLSSRFFGRQQRNNRHNANNTSQYEYVYVNNLSNTCGWRFDSYARIFGLCFQRKTSPCPVVRHSRWLCGAGAVGYLAAGNKG